MRHLVLGPHPPAPRTAAGKEAQTRKACQQEAPLHDKQQQQRRQQHPGRI
jgi:hypothetical protein